MRKNDFAVGGLENVGYAVQTDLLLVLSSQGRGVFDCRSGERVARDRDKNWWDHFTEETVTIPGFGPLEGKEIKTGGIYGSDPLSKTTRDGWSLECSEPLPDDEPFQKYLVRRIYLVSPDGQKTLVEKDGPCELRAYGFSETERSFVIALSCQLTIYCRT